VEWGKGIGSIEKEESIVARDLTLWYDRNKGSASDAAINEYKSLVDRYLALLNQVERLPRPPEAREVHNEYLDTYSGLYDATRFFYDYLRQNDNSLYDRSVASIRAVNKIASKASDDLWALMGKYGIVCTEIKMCKSDFATPTPQPVQAAAPTTTPEFPKIPAGMGGFIVVNYYGDPMTITIGGTLYDIAANGRQVIFLPPGRHTYSCNWGNKGWYTKEVDIVLGQYRILSFAD